MSRTIIIDQWLSTTAALDIGREFPPPDDPGWHTFDGPLEQGKQEGRAEIAGPLTQTVHEELASDEFVRLLESALGFNEGDLIADPDMVGSGIHQCMADGRLGLHVDFNTHPTNPQLVRAANVILFVSELGLGAADPGALVMRIGEVELGIQPAPGGDLRCFR